METLFRLTLTRPAIVQDENLPSIPLVQNSQFQAELGIAAQSGRIRDGLKTVARQFISSTLFTGDPKSVPFYDKLKALGTALDILEKNKNVTNTKVITAVQNSFGKKPADLVSAGTLTPVISSLKDSIIAIKQVPEEHKKPIEALTNQLRDIEVILKTAADNTFPGSGATIRRFRRRSVLLPTTAELRSVLSTVEMEKELEKKRREEEERKKQEGGKRLETYKKLTAAIEELTTLSSDNFQTTTQQADGGFLVPAAYRRIQLFINDMNQRSQLSQLNLLGVQTIITKPEIFERRSYATGPLIGTGTAATVATDKIKLISGNTAFRPPVLTDVGFCLKPETDSKLSAGTREILKERNLNINTQPLDLIVETLRRDLLDISKQLDNLLGRPVQRSFKRKGNTMVMVSTPLATVWNIMVINNTLEIDDILFTATDSIPTSHGSVSPVGVADLLVVKQQLVRYEATDVAHIENILKGEKKEREHTQRRETEEFNFRETEIITTEERELESTSRFEMSRESSETIKEDASLKAGLSVSGKYGPTVEFSASAEGSISRSKEEATKSAATFSQDVTERSANKITEMILERTSLRVTNEVIERNLHALDNTLGTGHISGVYQWVNKVYEVQMFNYGIRMMYDFMIPEPAAFLISSLQKAHANAMELEKPTEFTLRPDQITESNYHGFIVQYGVTDVQPPPEIYKTKSLDFNAGAEEENVEFRHSGQVAIDDGYKAIYGTIGCVRTIWEDEAIVDVVLGSRSHRFKGGDWVWSTTLDNETDSIPFALITLLINNVGVAVKVKCQRTDRAMLKWRLETHTKIMTAYKTRLSEYEEKLASLEMQAGVAIQGRNPMLNMELMNDEIKKHCITILTEQHYDLFNSIQTGTYSVPQINISENEAEGPYVRFFEQAFEWEQMTWLTYPYFWGRKSKWAERIAYEDVDPVFNQFLKAGYCRAVIPVRPGFEGAIDHFTTYGEIWNGGPLPSISNPLYLPIADEIAERLDMPGDEIPEGDPWLVRIPTTLVKLRDDDKLPKWKKDASSEWVED